MNGTMDLKPAVKQTVTPILQKAKAKCAESGGVVEEQKQEQAAPEPKAKPAAGPQKVAPAKAEEKKEV